MDRFEHGERKAVWKETHASAILFLRAAVSVVGFDFCPSVLFFGKGDVICYPI